MQILILMTTIMLVMPALVVYLGTSREKARHHRLPSLGLPVLVRLVARRPASRH